MRPSLKIVMFNVMLSAAATMLNVTGVTAAWGFEPSPGAGQQLQETIEAASSIQPGAGLGGTLFALYATVTGTMETVFAFVASGATMLLNIGLPEWAVAFLFAPQAIIVGRDLIFFLSGR